uniref:Acyl-CoA binding domain containing 4 n=1 Tax=Equus asinus asinus TaxID=83772 RepID=A0A8C4LPF2_EQUAS
MGTENESPEPDCQKQFQAAVSVIQNLPKNGSYRPSYEEMLRFYSYYKQATMGPCLVPRPGFWDPIGRYKWDAWNSLGKMSREEAMSAYITEMKLVAQKVIDTVPLGEVAEDMFGYFEPLYQVIPDMPRPPETFLRRVTGWKEQVLNGDAGAALAPPCLPKEPAPPGPESQPPRDLDSEVFSDSLEQLEPELVWAEQRGALGGEPDSRNSPVPPPEKAQCPALAPQALGSHAALLPPVALHCPVALPTLSDQEEVTQWRSLCSQLRRL